MTPRERAKEIAWKFQQGEYGLPDSELERAIESAITDAVTAALAVPLPTPMTDADLAEARRLVEAVTPGEWCDYGPIVAGVTSVTPTSEGEDVIPQRFRTEMEDLGWGDADWEQYLKDLRFIGKSPTLVRRLLDTVTALTGLLRDLGQDGAISQYQAGRLAGLREAVEVTLEERRQWTINGGALSACDGIETRLNALIRESTHV